MLGRYTYSVDCPCVTPEVVLKASGHVDKLTDLMVKDEKTGTCCRADHLLKDFCNEKLQKDLSISAEKAVELRHVLAVLDDLSAEERGAKIKEYGITTPDKNYQTCLGCLQETDLMQVHRIS